jgi:phosphatidylserine decarboxylase
MAVGAAILTLFVSWFFRNPSRVAPQGPGFIVAPGDGKVIAIQEEFEPRFIKDRSIRISIFLNVFDVHINRVPCEGVIEDVQYQPGLFLVASKPDATLRNEQNALMIRTAQGAKVLCVQVAGLIARRIVCWISPGDRAIRGERFGLIRFGSRMDTFFPVGTAVKVAVGDRVKGGETILGELR